VFDAHETGSAAAVRHVQPTRAPGLRAGVAGDEKRLAGADEPPRVIVESIDSDALLASRRRTIRTYGPRLNILRAIAKTLRDFDRKSASIHRGDPSIGAIDEKVDLIGDGLDAALRIAVLEDSSLVARQLAPVRRFIVAAPSYLARHGRPHHPDDLSAHHCLGYAYRARRDVWRLSNNAGDSATVTPIGPLRVNNGDALIPTVLAGLAIAELSEFIAFDLPRTGRVEALLPDWTMTLVGLYFVTPTARAHGAKVEALSLFLTERLSRPDWRIDPQSYAH
jgi:DNA-binding transcriptional LysR family regulator